MFLFFTLIVLKILLHVSPYNPGLCSQGFYLYLYIGSMVFLLYMYAALLRDRSRSAADTTVVASE